MQSISKYTLFLSLLVFPVMLKAQLQLTLQQAIDSAMKNNFDIRIARNTLEINKIYNNYGEAGGLPSVTVTGSDNQNVSDIYQKNTTGTETTLLNTNSNNLTAGANATMTLFNGFRIVATKERLKLLQQQNEIFLNQQIQNTLAAIMIQYYDIIRQQFYLEILSTSSDFTKKRLEIVTKQKNVGLADESDLLQSEIDVNMAEQDVKSQQLIVDQAKTDLLHLMSQQKFFPFLVKDTILIDKNLKLETILHFLEKNPQYLSAGQQVKINEQIVKEINGQRYPAIKINTGYNFSLANSDAGQYKISQTMGPTVGVTLQIPVFNGNVYANHRKAANYGVANARLEQESLKNSLSAEAINTYQSYSTTLEQLNSQTANYLKSGQLVDLMLKRFRVNQATILDLKAAQQSFEKTAYLLVNLQYAAKVAEIELKVLTYTLGK
ncbi:MAG: TolC family protein [Bacteroidetes bacterium]|nr:TolC family protein [Bacteroidota bacterium]